MISIWIHSTEFFPEDIMKIIIEYLEPKDTANLSSLNSNWHKVCRNDNYWHEKYIEECQRINDRLTALHNNAIIHYPVYREYTAVHAIIGVDYYALYSSMYKRKYIQKYEKKVKRGAKIQSLVHWWCCGRLIGGSFVASLALLVSFALFCLVMFVGALTLGITSKPIQNNKGVILTTVNITDQWLSNRTECQVIISAEFETCYKTKYLTCAGLKQKLEKTVLQVNITCCDISSCYMYDICNCSECRYYAIYSTRYNQCVAENCAQCNCIKYADLLKSIICEQYYTASYIQRWGLSNEYSLNKTVTCGTDLACAQDWLALNSIGSVNPSYIDSSGKFVILQDTHVFWGLVYGFCPAIFVLLIIVLILCWCNGALIN
jgi:hypothetical protein